MPREHRNGIVPAKDLGIDPLYGSAGSSVFTSGRFGRIKY